MLSQTGDWPAKGEIDIVEYVLSSYPSRLDPG
jgi:hypothetical protein